MIRNLVGTAVDVAGGALTNQDILDAFVHRDRTRMGPCAPGYALRLKQVYYDEEKYLADARGFLLQGNDELAL
jgi:tRNA U38,U39,U40 pseudouridine synthase TruA